VPRSFSTTFVQFPSTLAKMFVSNVALYSLMPFLSLVQSVTADTCSQVGALNTVELKRQLSIEYFQEQQSMGYPRAT
jgi:hypothetical protein